jgi:hypothetical protein
MREGRCGCRSKPRTWGFTRLDRAAPIKALRFPKAPRESGAKPELSRNCERGASVRKTPLR